MAIGLRFGIFGFPFRSLSEHQFRSQDFVVTPLLGANKFDGFFRLSYPNYVVGREPVCFTGPIDKQADAFAVRWEGHHNF